MMNGAILRVSSFARSSVFVGGQRRRTHTVSCRLRSCFRDTILNLARLHKCTSLRSKLSMVRRDIFDSGFAGHNRSIFNFKFDENALRCCLTRVCVAHIAKET